MRRVIFISVLGLILSAHLGCSTEPLRIASLFNNGHLQATTVIDPNNGPDWAEKLRNGNWIYWGTIHKAPQDNISQCRVKYHRSYSLNRWMVVEGRLGNGRKYPVILDTGASQSLFVNRKHVIENKLPVYPFESDILSGWGICNLKELGIGTVAFSDWPCFYKYRSEKTGLFGLGHRTDNAIIAGLPVLREFKYIMFDSVHKEATLSLERVFEPDEPGLWSKYPFVIEEDFSGNSFLFVKIPIAEQITEIQLDTGSGRGLAVSEKLWKKISKRIPCVNLKKAKDLYPYIGSLPCRRGISKQLRLGNRVIRNAGISVFPNDSPLMQDCDGLLGMQYFQDTVVVLDFERKLFWIKTGTRNIVSLMPTGPLLSSDSETLLLGRACASI